MLAIIGFYALMAGVFTFGKEVVLYAQPFFLTAVRLPTAGLIFLGYEYLYKRSEFYINRAVAPFVIAYGVAIACMDSARFISLKTLPAANAALVTSMAPFFAALLAHFFLDEKMTRKKILALCVGFCAILPIIGSSLSGPQDSQSWSTIVIAYMAVFLSMLGFVISGLFIKLLTTRHKYPMFMTVGGGMLIGGILGVLMSLRYDVWNPLPIHDIGKGLPLIAYLFVTHNLMAYPLYAYLLEHYPLTLIAFAQLLTPLFTAILRWIWFGEAITLPFLLSFIVLCGALYVFYKEDKKEGLIT